MCFGCLQLLFCLVALCRAWLIVVTSVVCVCQGHNVHAFLTRDGVAAVAIVSEDYPSRVAFGMIAKLAMDFVQVGWLVGWLVGGVNEGTAVQCSPSSHAQVCARAVAWLGLVWLFVSLL